MLGDFFGGEISAGKQVVVISHIEVVVVGQHNPAGECVDAEPNVLPAHLGGIEHTPDVVPGKRAYEALVAVAQFLAANLERHRKLFVIAQRQVGLMQFHRSVGLRVWVAIVAGGAAVATFHQE